MQSETYLLEAYRYIELNPVRALMVEEPSAYKWSSYRCNALGLNSGLNTPHELYLRLGEDSESRRRAYRDLFKVHVTQSLITDIRKCTNSGLALGNDRFVKQIEELTETRVSRAKMGRPAR